MRISLVIPTMWVNNVIVPCLQSLSGQYDELIIIDDNEENLAKKINKGLAKATGDYIVVSNDDIVLLEGQLKNLCEPGKVLSPTINNGGSGKAFHAHMWGMPREAYEKAIGQIEGESDFGKPGYYEGYFRFYYDDSDYWMKLLRAGFEVSQTQAVKIRHDHPATTLATFGNNEGAEHDNKKEFIRRWGEEALRIVL